ncbi:MAG: FAD-dependent oxidoreductase [Oleiphilaceae bacterium]|nr:FAD-dependent oxidoreductase [Oleiphilaceae bacterium]
MFKESSINLDIRRVAIIGSGLSGLTAGHRLRAAGAATRIFEKSRGPGGRLASKRVAGGSADIGAQYFTIRNPDFGTFLDHYAGPETYQRWHGDLRYQRKDGGWEGFRPEQRYVGVPRMTAIARQLARHLEIVTEVRIEHLARQDDGSWELFDSQGGSRGHFDAVIITTPPAQAKMILQNSGLDHLSENFSSDVKQMHACWTLAARFEPGLALGYDGLQAQSEILQWAGNNSSKPGRQGAGEWWVLHARPNWSDEHQDADPETVKATLLEAFFQATGVAREPADVLIHRWLYARSQAPDGPGHLWFDDQRLGIIGDWLSGGRVEGAFNSAESLIAGWQKQEII